MSERERRPRGSAWQELPVPRVIVTELRPLAASAWARGAVRVTSTLVVAELPGAGGQSGPSWHLAVSRLGKRPKPRDVEHVLHDFGMRGAEEDNHEPGGCRNFWLPVDPAFRGLCECKETEDVITEPDGFTWTNPRANDPDACRGCTLEQMRGPGWPCPIHARDRVAHDWQHPTQTGDIVADLQHAILGALHTR